MPRKARTPQKQHANESNSEGGKSAQEILLQLDPNFTRAVGILNKYHGTDSSITYNPEDLNQNKAIGQDSELTSVSQGNTGISSAQKPANRHGDLSEQRGGSTMSDLHNTEYMEESRATRSRMTPKTPSSKATELASAQRVSAARSTEDGSEVTATVKSAASNKPPRLEPPVSATAPTHVRTNVLGSASVTPMRVVASTPTAAPKAAPRKPASLERMQQSPGSDQNPTTERGRSVGSRSVGSRDRTGYSSNRSATSDDGGGEVEDEDDLESETSMGQPFLEPDPSAARDLDNASPKTIALCERHQCHYCFFVYFPSSSVDEDLMPFRRKAFTDKVSRLQNPEHVREVMETKCARDAYADRRIRSIERQSGTQIRLSELDPASAFVKGLPRRRLTIAGPTFAHIGCALNLFESLLPKVIKSAIFPFRLPEGASTRFASGGRQSSQFHWNYGRTDGTVFLRHQLDDKGGWRGFLVSNKGEH